MYLPDSRMWCKATKAAFIALKEYRKIPKISPGAYILKKALFEGLIFGGAYVRRKICISKSIGLALYLE